MRIAGLDIAPSALAARPLRCPSCGPSLLVRLGGDEMLVRCVRCRATPVHLSVIDALNALRLDPGATDAYELSTTGAVLRHLRTHCRRVATSEFLPGVAAGSRQNGIRCEDVQRLTFPDAGFDLCTSTEVFEHVPDDRAGFREIHRVLRPGGHFVFTVPLHSVPTVERAVLRDGTCVHLAPPAYHGDRLTGAHTVLVYRDYGPDIVERMLACGFASARLHVPDRAWFGHRRTVVVATR